MGHTLYPLEEIQVLLLLIGALPSDQDVESEPTTHPALRLKNSCQRSSMFRWFSS
jgi:hypothetical protein